MALMVGGTKALEAWCKAVTEGYSNVNILNMTTSWRSGLGFCAIINHFRPELLDYPSLDPDDVYGNNDLAFKVAEQHLGIPALLDPQDMVECELLDRLSILTYLSQFYQAFGGALNPKTSTSNLKSPLRTPAATTTTKSSSSSPVKRLGGLTCKICRKPVKFILERLNVNGALVHRTCFKCARCKAQLSLANYYETENEDYCCEMCPDEEVNQAEVTEANKKKILQSEIKEEDTCSDATSTTTTTTDESKPKEPEIVEEEPEEEEEEEEEKIKEEEEEEQQSPHPQSEIDPVSDQTSSKDGGESVTESQKIESPTPSEKIEKTPEVEEEEEIEEKKEEEEEDDSEEKLEVKEEAEEVEVSVKVEVEVVIKEAEKVEVVIEEAEKVEVKADDDYPETLNPFGEEEEEEDDEEEEEEAVNKEAKEVNNSLVKAVSTNPFEDEEEEETTSPPPPPKPPRTMISSLNPFGSDFEDEEPPQPPPPPHPPQSPSPSTSSTIRSRKKRPAPPPPPQRNITELPKSRKERDNMNRRSQILGEKEIVLTPLSPDKAVVIGGLWRKKKGPAPPRPLPPKRQVRKLPRKAVNTELHDIEIKQQELERQGVKLEKTIRELCEKSDAVRKEAGLSTTEDRRSLGPEAEDLIIQLFELVNEKNDLFRRQTELMYMKREHRLEEEHADLEYQIRVLMNKAPLTEEQKKEEGILINRLMAIVSQRNEIVDCLEMDRLRELEEDESIEIHMGEYAAIKTDELSSKKKKKRKNKKKNKSFDADKDVDTKEFPPSNLSDASSSPKPSPKKGKAKKLKKKILSSVSSLTAVKKS